MIRMVTIKEWGKELNDHKWLIFISLIFLVIALMLNDAAGDYTTRAGKASVPDIILDYIPSIDLSFIFVWGYVLVIFILLCYPLIYQIKEIHIVISQFSLLVLMRSFFISLTHLALPANAITPNIPWIYHLLFFHNDLFFSGHTAIPFLGFLIFRKEKIGIFFLIMTFILGVTVLLMHVHYSIDVFAAFFITYGCYKIGNWLFNRINHSSR